MIQNFKTLEILTSFFHHLIRKPQSRNKWWINNILFQRIYGFLSILAKISKTIQRTTNNIFAKFRKSYIITHNWCLFYFPAEYCTHPWPKNCVWWKLSHVHSNVQFHWHEQSIGSWMTYIISVPFPEQRKGTVRTRVPISRQHLQNLRWLSILTLKIVADGHFPSQEATFTYE